MYKKKGGKNPLTLINQNLSNEKNIPKCTYFF